MAIKFPGEVIAPYKPETTDTTQLVGVGSVDPITKTGVINGITISDYLPLTGGTVEGDLTVEGVISGSFDLSSIVVHDGNVITNGGEVIWLI